MDPSLPPLLPPDGGAAEDHGFASTPGESRTGEKGALAVADNSFSHWIGSESRPGAGRVEFCCPERAGRPPSANRLDKAEGVGGPAEVDGRRGVPIALIAGDEWLDAAAVAAVPVVVVPVVPVVVVAAAAAAAVAAVAVFLSAQTFFFVPDKTEDEVLSPRPPPDCSC